MTGQLLQERSSIFAGSKGFGCGFQTNLGRSKGRKRCATFETFSSHGPSDFLVISRLRWDKHQKRLNAPWRQNSSASSSERQWQAGLEEQRVAWSSSERKVVAAMQDYLERCAGIRVDIEVLERLMEPEEAEVCLRYISTYAMRRGSDIFQLFDTTKKDQFVASGRRWRRG